MGCPGRTQGRRRRRGLRVPREEIPGGGAGALGVDVFFALSGYLITQIIVREFRASDGFMFRRFYLRRAVRLYPALLAMVVLSFVVRSSIVPDGRLPYWLMGAFASTTYTMNFLASLTGWDTGAGLTPTWTLALEEQFYLLWPVLLVAMLRRGMGLKQCAQVAAGMTVVSWLSLAASSGYRDLFRPDVRLGGLTIGCCAALTTFDRALSAGLARVLLPASIVGFGGAYWAGVSRSVSLGHLGIALGALTTAVFIPALLISSSSLISRGLAWKPLSALGVRSYGVYLLHLPVLLTLQHYGLSRARTAIVGAVITLLLAELSYRFVERPFLDRRDELVKAVVMTRTRTASRPDVRSPVAVPTAGLAGLCATVAALMGSHHLGRPSLWFDESFSVWLTAQPWHSVAHQLTHHEGNQAAYFVLLKLWPMQGDAGVRFLSVLLAALTAIMIFYVGRRLAGDVAGVTAALLLSALPFGNQAAQEARGYALLMLAATVTVLVALRAPERPRSLMLGVCLGLLPYAHTYGLLIGLGVLPWAVTRLPRLALLRNSAVGAVLSAPMLTYILLHLGTGQLYFLQRVTAARLALDLLATTGFSPLLLGALFLALPAGIVFAWRSVELRLLLLPWLLITPVVLIGVSVVHPIYQVRYLAGAFPAACLVLAIGVTSLRPRAVPFAATAVLLASSLLGLRGHFGPLFHEDWRTAGAYLQVHTMPGDVVVGEPCFEKIGLFPYASALGDLRTCPVIAGAPRLWLVSRYCPATVPSGYRAVDTHEFRHVFLTEAVRPTP